jgi:hypothetical protein
MPCAGPPIWPGAVKETIMSNIIRTAVFAVAVIAGASASMAQSYRPHHTHYSYSYQSDNADRAFWDKLQRNGS